MNKNISLLVALGSSLALFACSGGAAPAPEALEPSHVDAPTRDVPPAPAADAGTTKPADIAKHCNVSSQTGDVCIENAEGHAGETIDVDVVLVGGLSCSLANEADGHIALDLVAFSVENQEEIVSCRTRVVGPDMNGTGTDLRWNAFGDHVVPGCQDMPIGKVDTIKIKIAAGTKPGDYDLTWSSADFVGALSGPSTCTSTGVGIAGKIRVLP